MKKRLLSLLLTMAMVLTLLPTAALATHTMPTGTVARTTTLNLKNTSLSYRALDGTSKTANPTTENIPMNAEGWRWELATKTLTLAGVHIQLPVAASGESYGISMPEGTVTIALAAGTQNLVRSGDAVTGSSSYAIYIPPTSTATITGTGSLTAMGGASSTNCGIYADTLNIEGGATVVAMSENADSKSYGIYATSCTVTGEKTQVTAIAGKAGPALDSSGIFASLTVNGGIVTASGYVSGVTDTTVNGGLLIAQGLGTGKALSRAAGLGNGMAVLAGTNDAASTYTVLGSNTYKRGSAQLAFGSNTDDGGTLDTDGYHWNKTKKTLTLKNLVLTVEMESAIASNITDQIILELEGTNVVHASSSGACKAISGNGLLAVKGPGKLVVTGTSGSDSATAMSSVGALGTDATLIYGAADVTAIGVGATVVSGVQATGNMTIGNDAKKTNGKLTAIAIATGSTDTETAGISAVAQVKGVCIAIGGPATGKSAGVDKAAILYAVQGMDRGSLIAAGMAAGTSCGAGRVTVNDTGRLMASGGTATTNSYGIINDLAGVELNSLFLEDSTTTAVAGHGTGNSVGIAANAPNTYGIQIEDTTQVHAVGETAAIQSLGSAGEITIANVTILSPADCGISTGSDASKSIRMGTSPTYTGNIAKDVIIGINGNTNAAVAELTTGSTTTRYDTVAEAMADAATGDRITLQKSVGESVTLADKSLALNLNSQVWDSQAVTAITCTGTAALTIEDTSASGTGSIVATTDTIKLADRAKVTVTGGNFADAKLLMEGGTVAISGGNWSGSLTVAGAAIPNLKSVLAPGYTFRDSSGRSLTETELQKQSYTGNLTVGLAPSGTADVTAGRYTWKQVFDCQRSPATPVVGQQFQAYQFTRPYDAVKMNQISADDVTTYPNAIFYFRKTGLTAAPFALHIAPNGMVGGVGDRAISTRGKIYASGSEGFLYVSGTNAAAVSGGYGYFFGTQNHANGDGVTYVPDDTDLAEDSKVTPPAPKPTIQKTTPVANFDGIHLNDVTTTMQYSLDRGSNWTVITANPHTVNGSVTETNGIWVKDCGDNTTTSDSEVQIIYVKLKTLPTIPKVMQGAALSTSVLSGGAVVALDSSGTSIPGTFTWLSPEIVMNTVGANQCFVHFAPTSDTVAPFDFKVSVTVDAKAPQSLPTATFETSNMTLSSVANTMAYSVDGGATWVNCTGATADLTGKAVTTTHGIQVYSEADGAHLASPIQTIKITKGLPPVYTVTQPADGVPTGAIHGTALAQYRNVTVPNTWTPASDAAAATLAAGTYEIRRKAAGNALASDIQTLVIRPYVAPVTIEAGRYTSKNVFDCQRSPAFPTVGSPFEVYDFAKPYDGMTGDTIKDDISSKVFYFKKTGNEYGLWMADSDADANAGGGSAITDKGRIYGMNPEYGFLYIGTGTSMRSLGYFISTQNLNEGGDVVYVPGADTDTLPPVNNRTPVKNLTPKCSFDANTGTLEGTITADTQYSMDGGLTWTTLSDVSGNVSGAVDESYGIWVRNKGNDITTLTSDVQKIYMAITKLPTATKLRVGDSLPTSTLSGGRLMTVGTTDLEVAGTWSWKSDYLVMTAIGDQNYAARFTPANPAIGAMNAIIPVTVEEKLPEHTGGGDYTPAKKPVIVDGKTVNIGDETKRGTVTTVTVDGKKLSDKIETAREGSSVIVTVAKNETATARLTVKNIEDMAKKAMTLTVQTGTVTYDLPTAAVDLKALVAPFPGVDTGKISFDVTIRTANETVKNATAVVKPISFTVSATYGEKTVETERFSAFATRRAEVTKEQAGRITTAVAVEPDGTLRHVPTKVFEKDGKHYAVASSMTNSVYAFIENKAIFPDVSGKWYEAVAGEVGGRKIIFGNEQGKFNGDSKITRAEYATMMVRALGLPAGKASTFTDVNPEAWHSGYIATAAEYGIVEGIGQNQFNPHGLVTRQEAMQMIYNAGKRTGFPKLLNARNLAAEFGDLTAVSPWATEAVVFCLNNHLDVNLEGTLAPTEEITRGEMAAMTLKLLQRSDLVDVRTK